MATQTVAKSGLAGFFEDTFFPFLVCFSSADVLFVGFFFRVDTIHCGLLRCIEYKCSYVVPSSEISTNASAKCKLRLSITSETPVILFTKPT